MSASPIKFGTSGWRGLIADDFTFANVRLAIAAIADHVNSKAKSPTILVGYDTRFYSEEFSQLAVQILRQHHIRTLLCDEFTPTPAIAYEITRRKLDGALGKRRCDRHDGAAIDNWGSGTGAGSPSCPTRPAASPRPTRSPRPGWPGRRSAPTGSSSK